MTPLAALSLNPQQRKIMMDAKERKRAIREALLRSHIAILVDARGILETVAEDVQAALAIEPTGHARLIFVERWTVYDDTISEISLAERRMVLALASVLLMVGSLLADHRITDHAHAHVRITSDGVIERTDGISSVPAAYVAARISDDAALTQEAGTGGVDVGSALWESILDWLRSGHRLTCDPRFSITYRRGDLIVRNSHHLLS